MDIETAIRERVSCPRLDAPAPTEGQLEQLLAAAIRAPDHGLLRPWRFIVVQDEARLRLGEMLAQCCRQDQPEITEAQVEKLRQAPLRAPMLLIVVAEVAIGHKVSVIDQIMACAAAVQNLLLCAHSIGVGAMWRTGAPALSPSLKVRLGFRPEDEIVGFVYLGTPCGNNRTPSTDLPALFMRNLPDA
jgi:nitroreductase